MVKPGPIPENFEKYVTKWCILKDPGNIETIIKPGKGERDDNFMNIYDKVMERVMERIKFGYIVYGVNKERPLTCFYILFQANKTFHILSTNKK